MKKSSLLILGFCAATISSPQRYIWSPDSLSAEDPNYGMNRYHDILKYHGPIMYISFPIIKPIVNRPIDWAMGKGKMDTGWKVISGIDSRSTKENIIRRLSCSACASPSMLACRVD
jgi:hypothetical protein